MFELCYDGKNNNFMMVSLFPTFCELARTKLSEKK